MSLRIGAPRRWAKSLAWRRSCIQSCRPNPGRSPCLLRGWVLLLRLLLLLDLMGRVVSFMVVVDGKMKNEKKTRASPRRSSCGFRHLQLVPVPATRNIGSSHFFEASLVTMMIVGSSGDANTNRTRSHFVGVFTQTCTITYS